jgi:hypothetical protein
MATGTLTNLDIVGGNIAYALRPADYVLARVLGAGAAESMTVPDGASFALFSATGDFYANYTATATVPGDVTNGQSSELNPAMRFVKGVASISLIAEADTTITVSFWRS